MEALPPLERDYSGDGLMHGDGYTTRAMYTYADRQCYQWNPPTEED